MNAELDQLKTILHEVNDLQSAAAVLSWDQETYMPPAGSEARARQLGTLQRLAQERLISPATGDLLDKLASYAESLPPDSDDAAMIRLVKHNYERMKAIPPARFAALVQHAASTYPVWARARAENNFALVAPNLEKTLDFSKEFSSYFPDFDHVADPLIDNADRGMTVESIRKVFAELRAELVPLMAAIGDRPQVDDGPLLRHFPEEKQAAFGMAVVKHFGFDPSRNRQDKTHHPFMTRFSSGDIRITTRYREDDFSDGFYSTLHETGHALYEMGIDPGYEGTPLASGTSAGVHESQSRLWENFVGRSREFWVRFHPEAQAFFPEQFGDVSLEEIYRAVNKVQPSLVRTDADEVTYNLHVLIRFDLEVEMLEGKLAIKDLPEAWQARYQSDLGVVSPGDADGVLQDVHWYTGIIGGVFQGYTLGNIIAAQLFEKALMAHPEIPEQFKTGEFTTLHGWMKDNVYVHGSKFTPNELLLRTTGGGLDIAPLVRHLRRKYGEIYGLS